MYSTAMCQSNISIFLLHGQKQLNYESKNDNGIRKMAWDRCQQKCLIREEADWEQSKGLDHFIPQSCF